MHGVVGVHLVRFMSYMSVTVFGRASCTIAAMYIVCEVLVLQYVMTIRALRRCGLGR